MGKAAAVLDVLPAVYGTRDGRKLMAEAVAALAAPLEAADSELFRIQRAHRLTVAPHARDIVNLAAALDLSDFHFEDLLVAPVDHDVRLALMRERVRRVARLHLVGLGTPWAVVEAAAIFLGAVVVGEPLLRRLDADGLSHRATLEFPQAAGRPRETLVLHENPFRRLKADLAPRWPGDGWTIESADPDVGPVRLAIRGVGERTVLPTVFCPALPGGIVFNGVVPDGETLVIDQDTGATLDGRDVTPWLVVYRGGMYDHVDADGAPFAVGDEQRLEPFGAAGRAGEPPPWARPRALLPRPPLGRTTWHFSVGQGVYDADDFGEAVLDPPEAPVGRFDEDPPLDACVYDVPASGHVGMAWDERVGCAFKLLLPAHVPAGDGGVSGDSLAGRIAAILPRFRAAGVTAYVDAAADGWELGRGVLRTRDAGAGEGVDFHSVRLVARGDEDLVQLDPEVA
jgi:hypothetical protein